jgi:hypothetical protein
MITGDDSAMAATNAEFNEYFEARLGSSGANLRPTSSASWCRWRLRTGGSRRTSS